MGFEGVSVFLLITNIFLLEFTSNMSLDKSGLSDTTITDKDELIFVRLLLLLVVETTFEIVALLKELVGGHDKIYLLHRTFFLLQKLEIFSFLLFKKNL